MYNNDYYITAPITPTYLDQFNHNPDVLDVTIIKNLDYQFNLTYIDDLSSDHNPVLITLLGRLKLSPWSRIKSITNWNKFSVDNYP